MTTANLVSYLGLGALYSTVMVTALWAVLAFIGRHPPARWLPCAFLTFFFVALTQHPLPSRDFDCARESPSPLVMPFRFVGAVRERARAVDSIANWLHDLTIASTVMNLLLCLAIGATLALCLGRLRWAVTFGSLLTLTVETAQLTAMFGMFPCPWRQFEVDDLILNLTGVTLGFSISRSMGIRPVFADDSHFVKRP